MLGVNFYLTQLIKTDVLRTANVHLCLGSRVAYVFHTAL